MILICYDGSQDARTAIERASGLFRGQPAVVLSVWEDFSNVLLRTGAALGGAAIDFEEIDQASEAAARERGGLKAPDWRGRPDSMRSRGSPCVA
jgi:hypothetical protein